MNTPRVPKEDPLVKTLAAFENSLLTPVVSGELSTWVATARRTIEALVEAFAEQVNVSHPQQLKVIQRDGVDLHKRVQDLEAEDRQIREHLENLTHRIDALNQRAERVGSDEGRASAEQQELVALGIDVVLQIRKQETALRTWFSEALNRDTGVAD